MIINADNAAIKALLKHIEDNVAVIEKLYPEWPNFNDKLVTPSVSIITAGTPEYINKPIEDTIIGNDPDNVNNVLVLQSIGEYNKRLQLDIWCEYKNQRSTIIELLFDCINKDYIDNNNPAGLSLTLSDYHDVIARYDIVSYNYLDNEDGSRS